MAIIDSNQHQTDRIAMFIPSLHGGGAERVAVNLLRGFTRHNVMVDLVLASVGDRESMTLPSGVRIVDLKAKRVLLAIVPLARYLRNERPSILLSHLRHAGIAAVLAQRLAGVPTRLAVVEHTVFTLDRGSRKVWERLVYFLARHLYLRVDMLIGVSRGVAKDLEDALRLRTGTVRVCFNPIVDDDMKRRASVPLQHPWLINGSLPVFLSVGRLAEEKDYPTLLKAFALLRSSRPARLIILGEGSARRELERIIKISHLETDVDLPGFVENPYAYMSKVSALVQTSRFEGFSNVLVEAMACGCPVISTDCPFGPAEILKNGQYGTLVPIGDAAALANAMEQVLTLPRQISQLAQRANDFHIDTVTRRYLELLSIPEHGKKHHALPH